MGYKRSRYDARMLQCNNGMYIEVNPEYDLTTDKWFRLPEAERISIREKRTRYKRSRGNYDKTVVRKITNDGVQDNMRSI